LSDHGDVGQASSLSYGGKIRKRFALAAGFHFSRTHMDVWILREFWQYGVAALTLILSVVASGHALLHKHDSRAAVSWVGLVWLAPLVGSVLYFIFGINRIHRRAVDLRGQQEPYRHQ